MLGALIIYVAIVSTLKPAWRQQAGVFIIGMALIVLTVAKEDAVYLGLGFAIIGGALLIAKPEARPQATSAHQPCAGAREAGRPSDSDRPTSLWVCLRRCPTRSRSRRSS